MIVKAREEGRGNRSSASESNIQVGLENLLKCVAFCINEVDCRRKLLLEYFGEDFPKEGCNKTCDNCQRPGKATGLDCSAHARAIAALIRTVQANRLPRLTLVRTGKLYSGSKDKELAMYQPSLSQVLNDHSTDLKDVGKITKTLADRLLIEMIVKRFLDEEVEMNGMGFSSGESYTYILSDKTHYTNTFYTVVMAAVVVFSGA